MEKATYSLSALKQCKELIRKNRWSTRLKAEHNSRCAEVNVLFASCQKLLNYVMFQPDLSPAYDYQQMVLSKSCTKKQLDNQLRVCHAYAERQITLIEDMHCGIFTESSFSLSRGRIFRASSILWLARIPSNSQRDAASEQLNCSSPTLQGGRIIKFMAVQSASKLQASVSLMTNEECTPRLQLQSLGGVSSLTGSQYRILQPILFCPKRYTQSNYRSKNMASNNTV